MALQLEDRYAKELQRIVAEYVDISEWQPVIFGSRAGGKSQPFSDIDLGFLGSRPLPDGARIRLWEALDDSDIPYVVDIVDFSQTSPEFRRVASQNMVRI